MLCFTDTSSGLEALKELQSYLRHTHAYIYGIVCYLCVDFTELKYQPINQQVFSKTAFWSQYM